MIPKGKGLPKFADDSTLNRIRGKAMVGHQTIEDVWTLLDHLQLIEHVLDEQEFPTDVFGVEGWRRYVEDEGAAWVDHGDRKS